MCILYILNRFILVASIWTWIIVIAWCSVVRYFLCIRASNPNSFEIIMPFECFTYAYSTTIYTLHRSHCHFKRTTYLYFKMLSLDCIYDLSWAAAAIATNQLGILDTFSRKNKIKTKKDREKESKKWMALKSFTSINFMPFLIAFNFNEMNIIGNKNDKKKLSSQKSTLFYCKIHGKPLKIS